MSAANRTRRNGIRFEVPVRGTGSGSDPYRPAIFDTHAGHFHVESVSPDTDTAVLWVDKGRTPDRTVEDIRNERTPLGTVLEEGG